MDVAQELVVRCGVEACERCNLILACSGFDEERICNFGFLDPDDKRLCRRRPVDCAVSGETVFVSPDKYPHICACFSFAQELGQ